MEVTTKKIETLGGIYIGERNGAKYYRFFYVRPKDVNLFDKREQKHVGAELWIDESMNIVKSKGFSLNSKGELCLYRRINVRRKNKFLSKSKDFEE
jgi:hypothetical protein